MSTYLSTAPYKGSRDFFPGEMRSRDWFFSVMSRTVESFGFEKIDAPLIEPLDIYLAKTSEEIVNQQIYSFTDRGDRKVAIRPEMTPTVSRMVAGKIRELVKPVRWYSIPNLWRYEQPGKGRLREHWQLNCDIFGAGDEVLADIEILQLAAEILKGFGANEKHFKVYISHRQLLNAVFRDKLCIEETVWPKVARVMDKKAKISVADYQKLLTEIGLDQKQITELESYIEDKAEYLEKNKSLPGAEYLLRVMKVLHEIGYGNYMEYNPAIVRGFDYYTSLVFEVYDTNTENRRSLFGGGRYNNLIGNFGKDTLNAVGFGMGDVTFAEFLRGHNLFKEPEKPTQVYIAMFEDEASQTYALKTATTLRKEGFLVEVSLGSSKLGKQFAEANQKKIPLVIVAGPDEIASRRLQIKDMNKGTQAEIQEEDLIPFMRNFVFTG